MPQVNPVDLRQFLENSDLLELDRAPHLWNINTISLGNDATQISGWCLPLAGRLDRSNLIVNGIRFAPGFLEKPAGVYAELYPWHPNAARAGFSLSIPHSTLDLRGVDEFSFEVAEEGSAPSGYKLCMLKDDLGFVIPDSEIAARIGVGDAMSYTMFGRSIYRGFESALISTTGKGFEGAKTILDWGCGSARVSRHIVPLLHRNQSLMGFDIDAPAVEWSNRNIGSYFGTCELNPPLATADAKVDVAFAYSVFTHLAESDFHSWLSEMRRILSKDGILLFTVLSDVAMAALAPSFPREAHKMWVKRGIYDDSGNRQLESIGVGGSFYRNTWVKRSFIESALKRAGLELVSVQSPFHFYQDLIVARPA